ncbi:hypothetical protein [Citricoccus alkalitolerans]|uniref:hypothetical protein n=1 Tax=Citricoccus alkalitolerans TaxID=246603 RepID=UPI0031D703AE
MRQGGGRPRLGFREHGPIWAQLVEKGLASSPEHGQLAFTVPGMADFIQRQHLGLHPESK